MARIADYVEVDVELDVSPSEFLSNCKQIEIQELIKLLIRDGYINSGNLRSDGGLNSEQWLDTIEQLKHLDMRMSIEDRDSILSIISKYTSIKYF